MHCSAASHTRMLTLRGDPMGADHSDGGDDSGAHGALLLGPSERTRQPGLRHLRRLGGEALGPATCQPATYLASLNSGATSGAELERQLRAGDLRMEPVNGGTRSGDGRTVTPLARRGVRSRRARRRHARPCCATTTASPRTTRLRSSRRGWWPSAAVSRPSPCGSRSS